jgi:glycine oxidase
LHHHPAASTDVAIIGGGVIGLTVAWRAAQRGLRVTVLERAGLGGGTSSLAAGMLAPIAEADPSEQALLRLGIAGAQAYPEFVAELAETSRRDPGYLRCGTLLAARDADEAQALDRALALRVRLGIPARRLRGSEARRLEPALAPTLRLALELADDHAIDPRALTATLAEAARGAGAVIREGAEVSGLTVAGDRVEALTLVGGERLVAEHVVVAAGVWSGGLAGLPPEARMPLRPVKGQILRLHDPAGPGLLRRVVRLEGVYVVPRGDGRYVLGATMEERGFDRTVTAGAVFELLREAIELLPGLSELVVDELAAGLRPGTPDNAPIVGPGAIDGLHWATGHYRNGILLAPITARLLVAGLCGEDPELDLEPFSPSRFATVATAAGAAGATAAGGAGAPAAGAAVATAATTPAARAPGTAAATPAAAGGTR